MLLENEERNKCAMQRYNSIFLNFFNFNWEWDFGQNKRQNLWVAKLFIWNVI